MTEHRFIQMRRIEATEPFDVDVVTFGPGVYWVGVCACGEEQLPNPDEDQAWQELADHFVRGTPEFREIAERNALLNLLNEMTPDQLRRVMEQERRP